MAGGKVDVLSGHVILNSWDIGQFIACAILAASMKMPREALRDYMDRRKRDFYKTA